MPEAINLIPQEEKIEQVKTKAVKTSTVFTILLLIIIALITGFLVFRATSLKSESASLDTETASLRKQIVSLSDIEIIARNLDTKTQAISNLKSSRTIYSKLLSDLKVNTPDSVTITDMVIGTDSSFTVSGSGTTYLSIADFMKNITDSTDLFTSVTLNTVNLDDSTQRAEFFITVGYNPAAFK